MIRAEKVNELYYARDNQPSFYQLKKDYHFIDTENRQYWIGVKNRQVLQNDAFKPPPGRVPKVKEPAINIYGVTQLYVKLTDPETKWFAHKDIGKPLILRERGSQREHVVTLRSQEKHNPRRRTGNVYVKGLVKQDLIRLLNT